MKSLLTATLSYLGLSLIAYSQVHEESDGIVAMEMEETSSPLDLWVEGNALEGFTGEGYLQFTGNQFTSGPARSPLEYEFQINKPGLYYLHLHCAKETHVINGEVRTDVANDCFVRVEGDYNEGPNAGDNHGDNALLSLLQNDTKYFGGAADAWKWENGQNSTGRSGNLDPGGHDNKRVAVYDFKAGETYKLVISGRSRAFRMDRIVFRHIETTAAAAQDLTLPASGLVDEGASITFDATEDFPELTDGAIDYYIDTENDALAIRADIEANRVGFARAALTYEGSSGIYDVTITTLTEEEGESTYRLLINGQQVATYQNPSIGEGSSLDLQANTHTWSGIAIPSGATIAIESNADSNNRVSEAGDGNAPWAWAQGRWQQIELTPSESPIRPPAGRLAIVADGNSPDPDDIGATAVIFGILNRSGLADRLVHLSHSCDLDPFSNPGNQTIDAANEQSRQNKLQALCGEGVAFFGPFPNLADYYNCRSEQAAAVNDLRNAINASTAEDPLWIIEAGEPDIIGFALEAADAGRRQFVNVVSHHPANDNSGDFFTWQQILDFGVTEHQIGDQNVGLQVRIATGLWDWAENHPRPELAWVWDQLKYAEQDEVVTFQAGKFDCSDAGMVYWWLTGASNEGNRNSTPLEMQVLLSVVPVVANGPAAHWPLDEGSGLFAGDATGNGNDGDLLNFEDNSSADGPAWRSDATRSSYLSFDGSNDRIVTPFSYALGGDDDFTWAWWANQQSTDTADNGAIMVGNRYPQPGAGGETLEFIKFTPTQGQFSDTSDSATIERYNYQDIEKEVWHHYAMVKTGTSYQWYVDGAAQGEPVTIAYSESAPIPFFIGGDDNGRNQTREHFQGFIDDVVLYQRALSEREIGRVIEGDFTPLVTAIDLLALVDSDAQTTWSDRELPHAGADYVIPATGNVRTPRGTSTFPGDSLQVEAGGKLQVQSFESDGDVTTINNLLLQGGDSFEAGEFAELSAGRGSSVTNVLSGNLTNSGYTRVLTFDQVDGAPLERSLTISSRIAGTGRIQSWEGQAGQGGELLTITNPANTFAGTWEAGAGSTLAFANPEAVGPAAIEVLATGKLEIVGDWVTDTVLMVSDEDETEVNIDSHQWSVAELTAGGISIADGTYTVAELNVLIGNAVFVGSGRVKVGLGGQVEPVAIWNLDEGTGSVANDSSGSGYHGAIDGAVWGSDSTRSSYLSFDGTDDEVTTLFPVDLTSSIQNFTWSAWVNNQADADNGVVLGNRHPDLNERLNFCKLTSSRFDCSLAGSGQNLDFEDLMQDEWHHHTIVKSGTTISYYRDGVFVNSRELTAFADGIYPFYIGGDADGNNREHFEGFIDDVIIYDRALSQEEIVAVRDRLDEGTTLTELAAWRTFYFGEDLANVPEALDEADADLDGENNLLEFATGQDPLAASVLQTPIAIERELIEFRYPRSKDAMADGLSFLVEWSDTLITDSWMTEGVEESIESDDIDLQEVVATVPKGNTGKRFVRLRVQF